MTRTTTRPGPKPDEGRAPTSKTRTTQGGGRLPHEHDESPDSQHNAEREPPEIGRQAFDDLRDGKKDTGKGPVYDGLRKQQDQ